MKMKQTNTIISTCFFPPSVTSYFDKWNTSSQVQIFGCRLRWLILFSINQSDSIWKASFIHHIISQSAELKILIKYKTLYPLKACTAKENYEAQENQELSWSWPVKLCRGLLCIQKKCKQSAINLMRLQTLSKHWELNCPNHLEDNRWTEISLRDNLSFN